MGSKININRLVLGGVIGGIAMLAIEFFVHAVLLHEEYLLLRELGTMRPEQNLKGELYHHLAVIMSGVPLSFFYVLVREKVGTGPVTAMKVGLLAWMICLPALISLYAFYNTEVLIPLSNAASSLAACIVGTVIAGSIYKD